MALKKPFWVFKKKNDLYTLSTQLQDWKSIIFIIFVHYFYSFSDELWSFNLDKIKDWKNRLYESFRWVSTL